MGLLNEFLLGDLPHAVQVGAVTAGHWQHISPTGLRGKNERELKRTKHKIQNITFILNLMTPQVSIYKTMQDFLFQKNVYRPHG